MGWENGLAELMSGYSSNVFTSTEVDWHEVVSCVPSTVVEAQNDQLLQPVSVEEVKDAYF